VTPLRQDDGWMSPRRRSLPFVALLAAAAAATAAGCNGALPADLFVVQRSGSIDGARLTLRISDDGGAYCNGGKRQDITSAQLITAREIRRELDGDKSDDEHKTGLAQKHITLKPGAVTTLSYRVRSEGGTVVFSDTSANQPQAFYRLAQLTRDVARGACGLPR
jgi:hypothetical protein